MRSRMRSRNPVPAPLSRLEHRRTAHETAKTVDRRMLADCEPRREHWATTPRRAASPDWPRCVAPHRMPPAPDWERPGLDDPRFPNDRCRQLPPRPSPSPTCRAAERVHSHPDWAKPPRQTPRLAVTAVRPHHGRCVPAPHRCWSDSAIASPTRQPCVAAAPQPPALTDSRQEPAMQQSTPSTRFPPGAQRPSPMHRAAIRQPRADRCSSEPLRPKSRRSRL